MSSISESMALATATTASQASLPLVNVPSISQSKFNVTESSNKDKKGKSYKCLQKQAKQTRVASIEKKLNQKKEAEAVLRQKKHQNTPETTCEPFMPHSNIQDKVDNGIPGLVESIETDNSTATEKSVMTVESIMTNKSIVTNESNMTKKSIKGKKGKSYKGLQKQMEHKRAMSLEMKLKQKRDDQTLLRQKKKKQYQPQLACKPDIPSSISEGEDEAVLKHEPEIVQAIEAIDPMPCPLHAERTHSGDSTDVDVGHHPIPAAILVPGTSDEISDTQNSNGVVGHIENDDGTSSELSRHLALSMNDSTYSEDDDIDVSIDYDGSRCIASTPSSSPGDLIRRLVYSDHVHVGNAVDDNDVSVGSQPADNHLPKDQAKNLVCLGEVPRSICTSSDGEEPDKGLPTKTRRLATASSKKRVRFQIDAEEQAQEGNLPTIDQIFFNDSNAIHISRDSDGQDGELDNGAPANQPNGFTAHKHSSVTGQIDEHEEIPAAGLPLVIQNLAIRSRPLRASPNVSGQRNGPDHGLPLILPNLVTNDHNKHVSNHHSGEVEEPAKALPITMTNLVIRSRPLHAGQVNRNGRKPDNGCPSISQGLALKEGNAWWTRAMHRSRPTTATMEAVNRDTRSDSNESTFSTGNDSPESDYGTATIISRRSYSSSLPSSSYSSRSSDSKAGTPPQQDEHGVHPGSMAKMSLIERARCLSTELRRHNEASVAERARLDEHRRCSQHDAAPSPRSASPTGTVIHHVPPSPSLSSPTSATDGSGGQVPPEPIRGEEAGRTEGAKKGQSIRQKAKRASKKVLGFFGFTKKH